MVLKMYSHYDNDSCGYVQGMNFTAGMMIYHCSPNIAFALFVKLLEEYDLRSNYLPGLPGLIEKCEVINQRFEKCLPRAHKVLED